MKFVIFCVTFWRNMHFLKFHDHLMKFLIFLKPIDETGFFSATNWWNTLFVSAIDWWNSWFPFSWPIADGRIDVVEFGKKIYRTKWKSSTFYIRIKCLGNNLRDRDLHRIFHYVLFFYFAGKSHNPACYFKTWVNKNIKNLTNFWRSLNLTYLQIAIANRYRWHFNEGKFNIQEIIHPFLFHMNQ